jgi:tripartite-type tricarboxylate transporter receptor subunit TctC
VTVAVLGTAAAPAVAQRDAAAAFPERPIRLIVPFAPQGPNDVLARLVGAKLAAAWNQQVVNPTLQKKLPYDTLKDVVPLVQLASSPTVLVVHPAVKATSIADLLALAKSAPGSLTYASGGSGTTTHLAGELFALSGGIQWTHIPYKGTGPANIDLLGGRVSGMFGTILPVIPHIKAGKMRAIGVTSLKPVAVLPGVPPVADTLPGFEAVSFFGIAVPAGVPMPVRDKINREVARIISAPEMRENLRAQGTDAVGNTQAEFTAFFRSEMTKWAKVIRDAGIKPE